MVCRPLYVMLYSFHFTDWSWGVPLLTQEVESSQGAFKTVFIPWHVHCATDTNMHLACSALTTLRTPWMPSEYHLAARAWDQALQVTGTHGYRQIRSLLYAYIQPLPLILYSLVPCFLFILFKGESRSCLSRFPFRIYWRYIKSTMLHFYLLAGLCCLHNQLRKIIWVDVSAYLHLNSVWLWKLFKVRE